MAMIGFIRGHVPAALAGTSTGCLHFDGVTGMSFQFVNANFSRTFDVGGRRTIVFRLDIQNLFNRQQYSKNRNNKYK